MYSIKLKHGLVFHQKYEKVLKTTQNMPQTVDNHQEQLALGLGSNDQDQN